MAKTDDDVDQLFRVPLDEFTAARNALAKRLGPEGKAVKELPKPSVPAWAVNQLYWQERATYDRLVDSAEQLRAAHRKLLAGKPSDVRETEKAHREAIRAALEKVRDILSAAGQASSPATMVAVGETLEALPVNEAPGRLTRPLKPLGFEALSGVTGRPSGTSSQTTPTNLKLVVGRSRGQQRKADIAQAKRDAAEAKREAAREKERQRQAREQARQAEAVEKRAKSAVAKAEREVARKAEELTKARELLERLQKELSDASSASRRARFNARD